MLAYVFWHWPPPGSVPEAYEAAQRRFQSALADEPPPGFLRSFASGIEGAPWANGGAAAYEDWYLLEGSAALDPLNEAAVRGQMRSPHAAAAAAALGGVGGLYRLRAGEPLSAPTVAYWFSKPEGTTYAALERMLTPVSAAGAAVWGRQMVLGPAPEWCVQAPGEVDLPAELRALRLALRPVRG